MPRMRANKIVKVVADRIPAAFRPRPDPRRAGALPDEPRCRRRAGAQPRAAGCAQPAGENRAVVERFGFTYRIGDKVMQVENNYDREVFNGDIGFIAKIDHEEGEVTIDYRRPSGCATRSASSTRWCSPMRRPSTSRRAPEYPAVVIPVDDPALRHAATQSALHGNDARQAPGGARRPAQGGRHRRRVALKVGGAGRSCASCSASTIGRRQPSGQVRVADTIVFAATFRWKRNTARSSEDAAFQSWVLGRDPGTSEYRICPTMLIGRSAAPALMSAYGHPACQAPPPLFLLFFLPPPFSSSTAPRTPPPRPQDAAASARRCVKASPLFSGPPSGNSTLHDRARRQGLRQVRSIAPVSVTYPSSCQRALFRSGNVLQ